MARDETTIFREQLAAIDTTHHNAIGNDGSRTVGKGLTIVRFLGAPELLTGRRIDRDERGIVGGQKYLVIP